MRNLTVLTTLSAALLQAAVALADAPVCGDVNNNGAVQASDALLVLRNAVGQPVTLTCDRCGSTCVGDPRYLLGEWFFESDFDGEFFEDNYDLFAVDEVNCEIVGQDLDDSGIVFAYAGADYDYILLDPNETWCDVFGFDYVGPDAVEGFDFVYPLDEDGLCDFDAEPDEGTMIGDRILAEITPAASAGTTALATNAKPTKSVTRRAAVRSMEERKPEFAALFERMRAGYAAHRRR